MATSKLYLNQTTTTSALDYWLETYWHEHGDPRLLPYPMMSSFRPFLFILASYSLFVLYLGPKFMKNREPFSMKPLLICYNLFMSFANAFFLVVGFSHIEEVMKRLFDVRYPPHDFENKWEMSIIIYNYLYLITKLIDLFDTVFFVLRKKQNQITALHYYHHVSVPFFGFIYFRLNAMCILLLPFCAMNSFLHVVMYAYYALSAMGPAIRPYLWWKRYLTQLQITQFVVLFLYGSYFIAFQQGYPPFLIYNHLLQASIYFFLFTRFYIKTYQEQHYSDKIKAKFVAMMGWKAPKISENNNGFVEVKEKSL